MLRGIVHAMSRPGHLLAGIRHLGEQHLDYGVQPEHYIVVRDVLKEMIAEKLGDEYTENRKMAWEGTIDFILAEMQKGYA
jgi:methyl-accepting chemotaxis protein